MQEPKPTRSELIAIKKRIKLAQAGHTLLKKKRDGLMREFFALLRQSSLQEAQLSELYKIAQKKMNHARMVESDTKIQSLAWAIREKPQVNIETRNIIGVKVPLISGKSISKKLHARGYEVFNSVTIDEAAEAYEKLIDLVVKVSQTQVAILRLVREIEKTKRRVNALEFSLIPRLQKQRRTIAGRLEEIERENFIRLKLIKTHLEEEASNVNSRNEKEAVHG
jgi:V/A-type H+/Na+-transporting ATPase subunit D